MTLDTAIKSIITQPGVDRVTFGLSENGKPIALCEQMVQTINGAVKSVFQSTGESHEDALESLKANVQHVGSLQTKIIKIKDN